MQGSVHPQKSPHTQKRALRIRKRALIFKKEPCVSAKEPSYSKKSAGYPVKEDMHAGLFFGSIGLVFNHKGRARQRAKKTYIYSQRAPRLQKEKM